MLALSDPTGELAGVLDAIGKGLERVSRLFDRELDADLPCVRELVGHVERYRGKMLRPTLVLACGLAVARESGGSAITDAHVIGAGVVEMVHMATLVHDDVLDESDTRRGAPTVARLHGNEAAVILGDYLIASAYRLCSRLDSTRVALLVGEVSRTLCAGELLQLNLRGSASIDEATSMTIMERKTGALIGLACRLGAMASDAPAPTADLLDSIGRRLGVAFQVQDDILDLTGRRAELGKPVGQDLALGKLTLPGVLYLAGLRGSERGEALLQLAAQTPAAVADIRARIQRSGSIERARDIARTLVDEAVADLHSLPDTAGRALLRRLALAVLDRGS